MHDPADWSDDVLRQECIVGTKRLAEALQAAGYYVPTLPPPPPLKPKPRPTYRVSIISTKERVTRLPVIHDMEEAKTAHDIMRFVCLQHRIHPKEVRSKTRIKKVVEVRRQICYECASRLGLGVSTIGRVLGIDHTSVMYHIKKYKACVSKQSSSPGPHPSIPSGEYSVDARSSQSVGENGWKRPANVS